MLCIQETRYIARILYQSMLKAPSGGKKGPSILARKLNSQKRSIYAFVRAAGGAPEGVKRLQGCLSRWTCKGGRQNPGVIH